MGLKRPPWSREHQYFYSRAWPRGAVREFAHTHESDKHLHAHSHGPHHQHEHRGNEGPEPHAHPHYHQSVTHSHEFVIDDHHLHWPKAGAQ